MKIVAVLCHTCDKLMQWEEHRHKENEIDFRCKECNYKITIKGDSK